MGSAIDDNDGALFPMARGIASKVVPDVIISVGDAEAAASPVGSAGDIDNGVPVPVARGIVIIGVSDAIISVVEREMVSIFVDHRKKKLVLRDSIRRYIKQNLST